MFNPFNYLLLISLQFTNITHFCLEYCFCYRKDKIANSQYSMIINQVYIVPYYIRKTKR